MPKFEVKQSDLTIEARYAAPAFALLRPDGQKVIEHLLSDLTVYGATVDGVHYNVTGPLGGRNVTINIPTISAGVKVFVGKAEAGFNDLTRVRFADIQAVARALFGAIDKVATGLRYVYYSVLLNYHGVIEGKTVTEFIRQYVTEMPKLGPVNGAAAGFYYGKSGPREALSVVVDSSVAVPGALYTRISAIFDGKQVSPDELPEAGAGMVREVLRGLGIEHSLDLGGAQ